MFVVAKTHSTVHSFIVICRGRSPSLSLPLCWLVTASDIMTLTLTQSMLYLNVKDCSIAIQVEDIQRIGVSCGCARVVPVLALVLMLDILHRMDLGVL
jgi:hypothetical protein